ncbi:MAG: flagellar basal body rod protein FlgB [Deltaproteobacteria bacterium]|nr:MAG: flagellar basal body rod protein FlgB [Deltaproteobacteria bacterium]
MKLFGHTLRVLEIGLDSRLRRHEILSGNVANADTPGYRGRDLDVRRATIRRVIDEAATASGETGVRVPGTPEDDVYEVDAPAGLDGNTVDIDRTMAGLAQNGLEYSALAKSIRKKLALLRYVVTDGQG